MRRGAAAAIAAALAALTSPVAWADDVTLGVTDPRDGYRNEFAASWVRSKDWRERYWLCDRPVWVEAGIGARLSRLYQQGYQIELVATDAEQGERRILCKL